MMRTRSNLRIFSGKINYVPLLDLLFLLFMFFLVSTSLVFQPGIPVDLPMAHGRSISAAEKIIITIAANNKIYLNDRPVPDYELQSSLQNIVDNRTAFIISRLNISGNEVRRAQRPRVVIRADHRVPYARIVEVMSMARSMGLGVYLVTDQEHTLPLRMPRGNHR